MRNAKLARRYAEALGELAHEKNLLSQVEEELSAVREVLRARDSFRWVFESRDVSADEKERLIKEVFKDRLSRVTLNFLLLVISKRREVYLDEMIEEYSAYANRKRGIVEVELTAAQPLSSEQMNAISARLADVMGKEVRLKTREDEAILGGIVARVGDLVMDGSVKSRLARLHEALKRAQLN